MAAIDIDALLAPVSEAAPCGDDLAYDAAFLALEDAARGKAEQQFGDTLIPAQDPDWRAMKEQSLELFARTRDVRIAIHLLRALTRLEGSSGFATAIRVVHGLLERHWEGVHPVLDADENDDATMRLNALAPLADAATVLADLRSAAVGAARAGLTVRQIELAFGKVEPQAGEPVPTTAGIAQALGEAAAQSPGLLDELIAAHEAVRGLEAVIDRRAGAAEGPDLRALRALTQSLAQAAQATRGDVASTAGAEGGDGATGAGGLRGASGPIGSRDDAVKTLDRVCEWIERNEPTNPAPLLIRRAQRLMTKSFIDIIRDLAPDGLTRSNGSPAPTAHDTQAHAHHLNVERDPRHGNQQSEVHRAQSRAARADRIRRRALRRARRRSSCRSSWA